MSRLSHTTSKRTKPVSKTGTSSLRRGTKPATTKTTNRKRG